MSSQILDGKGRGYRVEVSSENQLMTKSINITRLSHQSIMYGNAYIVEYLFEQQVGDTPEFMGYSSYTGSNVVIIEKIHITTRDPDYTYVDMFVGTYLPTGGVSTAAVNWNTSSSKTLALDTYHQNDGASSISATADGQLAFSIAIKGQGTYELDVRDAFIWRPGLSLSMKTTCKNANSLVRAFTSLYELNTSFSS